MSRKFPYNVPLDLINIAQNADYRTFCGMDGGWPSQFIPEKSFVCSVAQPLVGQDAIQARGEKQSAPHQH